MERRVHLRRGAAGHPVRHGRATVLIETIPAAFEMDEILYELRDHASGLNAGRWDYLFSIIKYFRDAGDAFVLPDRASVTMTAPLMRAYTELLVATCHRRGAFAIGGMAAFIPSRRDPEVNERALAKVRDDKEREAGQGSTARGWRIRTSCRCARRSSTACSATGRTSSTGAATTSGDRRAAARHRLGAGATTEAGLRNNVDVALRYLAAWLGGNGAVGIHNLMEDAATAEISRSQVWQWVHNDVRLDTGETVTPSWCGGWSTRSWRRSAPSWATTAFAAGRFDEARELFERVALADDFVDFLTLPAYESISRT